MKYGYGYFEEDHLGHVADIGLWKRIFGYSKPHWQKISLAVLLSILITGTSLILPYLLRLGIDNYIVGTKLDAVARINGLTSLSAFFVVAIFVGFAANFFQVIVLEYTGQTIMHRIRQQLFSHMLSLDLDFFNKHPSGKLTTRVTNDIQNMYEMFTSVIVTLFNDCIQLIGIMVVLYYMNWRLALLICLILPFIILNTMWFSRLARDAFRSIRTQLARINSYLQESLSGLAVIQIFQREKDTYSRFVELSAGYLQKNLYQIKIFALFMPAMEVFSAIATGCILWYGGGEIIRQQMTLGELVAFLSYMRLFFQPLRELSQKYSIVQSAMASAERIFQLLDTKPTIKPVAGTLQEISGSDALQFRNVSFSYDGDQQVLHNINFKIKTGQTLAIVGATGSGKSTIVNLLERFYDPDQGEIFINGQNIRQIDNNDLRHLIGLVLQDVFVIAGTVRDNILLGRQISDDKLADIIDKSQMTEVVKYLPNGIETHLGEGGFELSSGQKQLLAFARVLARDPLILVLDEATASVDTQTEMLVERAVASTLINRTSIIIAHRLSTIRRADMIIAMEHGRITESGTHEELMMNNGIYRRLQDLLLAPIGL